MVSQGEKIIVVGIYAPNDKKSAFYSELGDKLMEWMDQKMILMGDFNGVVSPNLDKLTKKQEKKEGKLPRSFFDMVNNLGLTDAWRLKNPTIKQYTFFSNPNQSWGRIDSIWISKELTQNLIKSEILPRIISDHNAVYIELKGKDIKTTRWRMNEFLFNDQKIVNKAIETIEDYFKWNLNGETAIETVWDAGKAVMRGFLIQKNSQVRKEKESKKEQIPTQIMENEKKLTINPSEEIAKQNIKILQAKLSTIIDQEVEWKIKMMNQRTFESANKIGKYLAQIRERRKQNTISKIREGERIVEEPKEIRKIFQKYYKDLYKRGKETKQEIEHFLQEHHLKQIPKEEKEILDQKITQEEIKKANKKMKNGKVPGPDGLSAKYYKTLSNQISPVLGEVMNNILKEGRIPNTWKEAYITLIPKKEADTLEVKNYRPISLLNNDYKLFADIMAERLKKVLNNRIHKDQTGFLPGRQLRDNVRNLIDIIEYLDMSIDRQAALVFIDAEKAFDNISWDFLKKSLEMMGMGEKFRKGIEAIYKEQKAKLVINNTTTEYFSIYKGTRQGCPLSPLLFITVLEILNERLRGATEVTGVKVGKREYKIKAFADDIVLTLEDPKNSVKEALQKIDEFGAVAGLKVNKNKTKMLVKNLTKEEMIDLERRTEIAVAKKVKYLGIWVTAKNINLYKDNYDATWRIIKKDMEIWGRMKLSFLGRIAVVKMNILPRMLFLFQTIPILKGLKQCKEWQRALAKYIWQGKRPRIKMKILIDKKERGGFSLPDLSLYYEAACILWLKDWIKLENRELLDLEGFNNRYGWHSYLWYGKVKVHKSFLDHIFRGPLYQAWERNKNLLERKTPWWISPIEALTVKKINMEEINATYEEMLRKTDQGPKLRPYKEIKKLFTGWLQYHQVNDLLKEDKRKVGFDDKKSKFNIEVIEGKNKTLSRIYDILLEWYTKDEEVKEAMIKWAIDFGYNIDFERWIEVWNCNIKFTACMALRENIWKMLYRWYHTPVKLAKMYRLKDKRCWKCGEVEGDLYHLWWTCKKVKGFWESIYNELKKIFKYTFPKRPEAFLLGMMDKEIKKEDRTIFLYATTAARIMLAQYWKVETIPNIKDWQIRMVNYAELDKLTGKIRDQDEQKFLKNWSKFWKYIGINV
uniref:Reverse transcriptase domain-containing protein n=1 Tax=Podarcis muralis TaxID=64176 RepID=A0A670II65_PODMU